MKHLTAIRRDNLENRIKCIKRWERWEMRATRTPRSSRRFVAAAKNAYQKNNGHKEAPPIIPAHGARYKSKDII
jgi:hypothetical protein